TGTMAADVMDVQQDIQNDGTININPGMNITVTEGKWIINKGTINFMKTLTGDGSGAQFNITGTNDGSPSGIVNRGPEFAAINGAPTEEAAQTDGAMYFNLDNLGGTIQVKDPTTKESRALSEDDYECNDGGTIQMKNGGLYNFLRKGGDSHVNANNVIVLRGTHSVSNNMILLDHTKAEDGASPTSANEGEVLDIRNPFVNSDDYKSFKNGNNPQVVYDKSYGLGVNGYFKFSGINTNFDQGKVEFMDGSSEFNSANSIFGTNDLTISGGNVNINISEGDPAVVLSGRTINVTSHKVGDEDVYGCLVVTNGNVTLDKDSILNLGYNPQ
ncbi:MAG: hypothetical protein IJS10_03355, partial [Alphaproteobacteria bacterium]|nr:hypothetical protein [Alphaproteobacteria bacterium]